MKISKTEFLAVLQSLKPGIAKKEIVEQFTSFIFTEGLVFSFNDDIAVQHPIDCDIVGSINAEKLAAFMGKVSDESIEAHVVDNEVVFKCGKVTSGFKLIDNINDMIARLEGIGYPETWYPIPTDFIQGVSFCLFSASRDATRPVLTCLNFDKDRVESSDGNRFTIYKFDHILEKRLLIPAIHLRSLTSYEITEYGVTNGWVHFKMANEAVFSCRTFEPAFPDLSKFDVVEGPKIKIPPILSEVVDRAKIFTSSEFDQDKYTTITIDGNRMFIEGRDSHGWLKERVTLDVTLDTPITFRIQPDFLIEISKILDEMIIGKNLIKLAGANFTHCACIG